MRRNFQYKNSYINITNIITNCSWKCVPFGREVTRILGIGVLKIPLVSCGHLNSISQLSYGKGKVNGHGYYAELLYRVVNLVADKSNQFFVLQSLKWLHGEFVISGNSELRRKNLLRGIML